MEPDEFIAHKLAEARRAMLAAELEPAAAAVKVALDYALLISRDHPVVVEALRLKAMVHGRIAAEAEQLAQSLVTVSASSAPETVVLERLAFPSGLATFEEGQDATHGAIEAAQSDDDWAPVQVAARNWLCAGAAHDAHDDRLVAPLTTLGQATAAVAAARTCPPRAWLEGFYAANIADDEAAVLRLCGVDTAGWATEEAVPAWVVLHIRALVALRTGQEGLAELVAQTRDIAQQELRYDQHRETALFAPSHLLMMEVLAGTPESFNANLLNAVGVHHDYYREHAAADERLRGALALGPAFYARMAHRVHGWPIRVRSGYIPGWLWQG